MNNDRSGQFWASWAAYVSFFRDVMGWQDDTLARFALDEEMTLSCGWVWWHQNVLVIADRPRAINRDAQGRLHNLTGPAIRYPDGWALYSVHGVRVPADIIEQPASITVERIEKEGNAEVRRVMIERYGQERYLKDSGAKMVHEAIKGGVPRLWRKELAGDEALVMVEVLNSTPEPDGTIKTYFLRVPPTIRKADEAVAWGFNKKASEYAPSVET